MRKLGYSFANSSQNDSLYSYQADTIEKYIGFFNHYLVEPEKVSREYSWSITVIPSYAEYSSISAIPESKVFFQ